MSFFFNKQENKDNLSYDDTAFMHFAITSCLVTSLVFMAFIYLDLKSNRLSLAKIKNIAAFQGKIKNTMKSKKKYIFTMSFLYKFAIILGAIVFGIFCFSNIKENSQMIGFDPYEIMGVQTDAPLNIIKKAYRKLALQYHPDRNANNPEVAAKFIRITKAYKCLTDEQAKESCRKYGNPDGNTSFKVGIGLPHFMIDVKNQYFILIPIFVVLLFVVPRAFIKWSSRIKPVDDNGNLIANYGTFYDLFTPAINPITFSLIMGSMKQLDIIFPEKKALDGQLETGFKNLLLSTRAVSEEQLQKISPHILFRACSIYSYMANRSRKEGLAEMIPNLCRKIIMFTLYYTQKSNDQKMLLNNPNWIISYYGVYPTKLAIFFSRQMFNPTVRIGDTKSIEFLDLTPEQCLLAQNIPIGNLPENLLWNDQLINTFIGNFAAERQSYVRQQIESLPAIKVQARVLLGEEEVTEMTIDDFAVFEIKISRKKQTPGFVLAKDYPCLAKEEFYLFVQYNLNLLYFTPVTFKAGENEVIYKYQHRQTVERQMKFDIWVMSANYPNMDLYAQLNLNVIGRIQNRRVEIHRDDQNIQKMPKNFFESLATMDALNESDRELSQGSDDEDEQKHHHHEEQESYGFRQEASHGHHCQDC